MNNIHKTITTIEKLWLKKLFDFSTRQFATANIPSHDQEHHLRVWKLAKELILDLTESGHIFSEAELEEVIIAVMLHDIGMTVTVDTRHGHESRIITEQFLRNNPLQFQSSNQPAILEAIERHDDKAYKHMVYNGTMEKNILSILCVCDDLDAFGYVGIFRYLEIYHLRGKTIEQTTETVLKNIKSRFQNFEKLYGHLTHVHAHNLARYRIIKNFFENLKQAHSGALEVTHYLIDGVVNGNQTIHSICRTPMTTSVNNYTKRFFAQLKLELTT